MPSFKINVFQVFRTERTATITVEASDIDAALGIVDSGDVQLPGYDDPAWTQTAELMAEHSEAAI